MADTSGIDPIGGAATGVDNPANLNNNWLMYLLPFLAAGGGAFASPTTSQTSGQSTQTSTGTTDLSSSTQNFQNILNTLNSLITGSQTGTTTGTTAQTVTPTLSPEAQVLQTQLAGKYSALTAPSLTGYGAMQTANINQQAEAQRRSLDSILASRGLSTSPVAGTAQAGVEQNRLNQVTSMQQQLPLLQQQMNLQNLAGATGFFGTMPKGTTSTGTTTQNTQQDFTQAGSQAGSQTSTGGSNTQQQTSSNQIVNNIFNQLVKGLTGGGIGGAVSGGATGLAALLPYLTNPNRTINITQPTLSDKRAKKNIQDIPKDKALEKVRQLRAKTWDWKPEFGTGGSQGVVAQELEKVMPELVLDNQGTKFVNYGGLIPYLIGAVQELDSRK